MDLLAAPPLGLRLFGPFEARVRGHTLRRLRTRVGEQLLTLLVLRRDRDTERSQIAEILWPESEPWNALDNLRRCLTDLRHALGAEARRILAPTGHSLRIELAGTQVDLVDFDQAIGSGDENRLADAIALYRGPLLEGCTAEWLTGERSQREYAYVRGCEVLAAHAMTRSDARAAVGLLHRAVATNPLCETAVCALMEALAASGDSAAATVAYRQFREQLHREMSADPASATTALFRRLLHPSVDSLPAPNSRVSSRALRLAPGRHLPRPLTALVGREAEIRVVADALDGCRLVMLSGPGGVGKTRLAIAAAEAAANRYQHGAWFVDLTATRDFAGVTAAVARALGIREQPGNSSEDSLCDGLRACSTLLVLDNCEQVIEGCSMLVGRLTETCPDLRILVTSRRPLGMTGERLYRVPPLGVPEPRTTSSIQDTDLLEDTYEGIRLFTSRATDARPAFRLTRENACSVVRICDAVEGNPLAIELAAAWCRALPAAEIAARLENRLAILQSASAAVAERHRTLSAVLDTSYELLSESEGRLLQRLSVFRGGWTLDAAESVFSEDGDDAAETVSIVAALVDQSLVVYDDAGSTPRYRLLETVRQYAARKLRESGELLHVRERHAEHFLDYAERLSHLGHHDQGVMLDRFDADHNNFGEALNWFAEDPLRANEEMRLAGALAWFWNIRGHLREGADRLTAVVLRPLADETTSARGEVCLGLAALTNQQGDYVASRDWSWLAISVARAREDPDMVGRALTALGDAQTYLGEFAGAEASYIEALGLARDQADQSSEAFVLQSLGVLYKNQGSYSSALSHLRAALRISREIAFARTEATILHNLGNVLKDSGALEEAAAAYEESLAIHRKLDDRLWQGINLFELAFAERLRGDTARSNALAQDALALCEERGSRFMVANCLGLIGDNLLEAGDIAGAWMKEHECLAMRHRYGQIREIAFSLASFGALNAADNKPTRAAVIWGAEESLRTRIGIPSPRWHADQSARLHAQVRQTLGDATFEAEIARGRAMSMDEAVAFTLGAAPQPVICRERDEFAAAGPSGAT